MMFRRLLLLGNRPTQSPVVNPTLPNYRAALAAAKAGTTGPLIINVVGDSTTVGAGAGGSSSLNDARKNAIGHKIAEAYSAQGLSKNGADIFGTNFTRNSGTNATYVDYNPSLTPNSWSFTAVDSTSSIGGNTWTTAATGTPLSWTAEGRPFNKITFYHIQFSSGGTYKLLIDGTNYGGNITSTGTSGIARVSVAVPLGVHTVQLQYVSGGTVFLVGMETFDTTNKQSIHVRNLGQGSVTSTDIAENPNAWSRRVALATVDPASLHVVEGGLINDWNQSTSVSGVSTNLTTIMTALQTQGGDVLLIGPTRSATSGSPSQTAAVQQSYVDAMAALANGTTKVFYDLKSGTGDFAAMSAAGRMFDQLHPNASGYTAQAAAIVSFIG